MARLTHDARRPTTPSPLDAVVVDLERSSRGLLEVNVGVLEDMERRIGLSPLRALQSLERRGPSWSPSWATTSTCWAPPLADSATASARQA